MYEKSLIRTSLNNLKLYIKLGVIADEFGINRSTLSMFLKSDAYDYQLSLYKANEFYDYVFAKLKVLID